MQNFKWLLYFLPLLAGVSKAQLVYTFNNLIPIKEGEIILDQPFSGGFIAPQYSVIDLDLDGVNDLFVFDRASSKVFTYLFKEGKYAYEPLFESYFPQGLTNWVLLRDYNCDGKMDLFTSSIFGMSLYENTSTSELSWSLKYQTIYTEGSNGQTNLQVSGSDLPAITDVDNDGDLDILNFNFATGGSIELHKNMSVENTGLCGLELVRTSREYGDFKECTCDTYAFGTDDCLPGGKIAHSGGRTILSFSYSSQEVQDLLIGQEYCFLSGYLPNTGTVAEAKIESVSFDFPNTDTPLQIEFPAFYELDLYNDGVNDLLVAPNFFEANGEKNYRENSFLYTQNSGGEYEFVTNTFLKNKMIDVGQNASPVFADIDFDGDEDLLIGSGRGKEGASIWYYENIGSSNQPSFLLKTTDYLGLSLEDYTRIKIQLFDVDENEFLDLVLTTTLNNEVKSIVMLHTGNPLEPYLKSQALVLDLPDLALWDSPYFYKAGTKTSLFIGKNAGNLMYYSTSDNIITANWQLESEAFLAIEEDFMRRNLSLTIADVNVNKTPDMVLIDDSGEVVVYDDFLKNATPEEVQGFDTNSNKKFNLNFGKITNIAIANLDGNLEPSLVIGLLTGGVQLLTNTQVTKKNTPFVLKIIAYPNPIQNKQVVVQSNKNGIARVLDGAGKEVIRGIEIKVGHQNELYLNVCKGVYFLEVKTQSGEKQALRLVVSD
ncbi:MAG: T9SS type A sorting domain-containing protein [Cyclobacteriaceae bacterium]|nr:T9SS type A sorting domain-containing protein [Cyclobacteriaceae bacterium]